MPKDWCDGCGPVDIWPATNDDPRIVSVCLAGGLGVCGLCIYDSQTDRVTASCRTACRSVCGHHMPAKCTMDANRCCPAVLILVTAESPLLGRVDLLELLPAMHMSAWIRVQSRRPSSGPMSACISKNVLELCREIVARVVVVPRLLPQVLCRAAARRLGVLLLPV